MSLSKFPSTQEIYDTLLNNISQLQSHYNEDGYFKSHLSSSALSSAVAMFALYSCDCIKYKKSIILGYDWLVNNKNIDGGWGDTSDCPSNLSTTLLAWAACRSLTQNSSMLEICNSLHSDYYKQSYNSSQTNIWLQKKLSDLQPPTIAKAVIQFYGKDRTFAVPILAMLALTGVLGSSEKAWKYVPQLPFEMTIFPRWIWNILQLQVVSYAIPALVAIGRVKHYFSSSRCWPLIKIRNLVIPKTMKLLQNMQPTSGGFLEAIPLTAFVVMSLVACGEKDHPVVQAGIKFLESTQNRDGSWPIDVNLHTWTTTLAINSLATISDIILPEKESLCLQRSMKNLDMQRTLTWLLQQQWQTKHPFTQTSKGGWAWTFLDGGVPDADDTSGALVALHHLLRWKENSNNRIIKFVEIKSISQNEIVRAAELAINWLLQLQNHDGGIPTFCRGWGKLPFDRSCSDITAHCLYAFMLWLPDISSNLKKRCQKAILYLLKYLSQHQQTDGSWLPLWFGNPFMNLTQNTIYGTAKVSTTIFEILQMTNYFELSETQKTSFNFISPKLLDSFFEKWLQSIRWLLNHQNSDGGWGLQHQGISSIEETSLALSSLLNFSNNSEKFKEIFNLEKEKINESISQGINCLIQITNSGKNFPDTPIGLYFASLWYSEQLYPIIFTIPVLAKTLQKIFDEK